MLAVWALTVPLDTMRCRVISWIRERGAEGNIVDIGEEMRQKVTEVKIAFPVSHNTLTIAEEYVQ
jgi:hypothetical protein